MSEDNTKDQRWFLVCILASRLSFFLRQVVCPEHCDSLEVLNMLSSYNKLLA